MKYLTLFIIAFFLFGCNEKTYTVSEFENNSELRDEYNKKCINGELNGDSLNCQNVNKAIIGSTIPSNTGKWN